MATNTTGKLEIGKDIFLERGEKLLTYRNKINGEIVYSSSFYEIVIRDGKSFVPIFKKPNAPKDRRINLIALDALERVPHK